MHRLADRLARAHMFRSSWCAGRAAGQRVHRGNVTSVPRRRP